MGYFINSDFEENQDGSHHGSHAGYNNLSPCFLLLLHPTANIITKSNMMENNAAAKDFKTIYNREQLLAVILFLTYCFFFSFFSCFHFFTFTLWCDTAHVILSVKVTEAEIFSVWKHHCWSWRMIIRQKSSWMETHENHYLKTSVFIWSIKTINSATSMKTWKLSKQYRHRGSRLREAAD